MRRAASAGPLASGMEGFFAFAVSPEPVARDNEGFFGPHSVVWKVDRELAVLLGSGSRALLLQVAHPLVAAAVAEHSRYRRDPIGRLRHTLEAIYSFAFADRARAVG